eukprot:CAMPEP_0201552334 /NCGR_PEP_ID=MMETSP0173_2-20130828/15124_1 /ASSEMBLY_ACC=CAM_ASM_000268 /TAXON_ID=218659 /ORGANISM="Vexillifera sp., Strain DIVA3 564/2" /LENGTH=198 /DNA_ID=CAMNT_0047962797 /DNA_START=47 /DNA_END=640 /DNA_ORIENTATION=-
MATIQEAQVIFVIGGPGSGKGTVCTRLKNDNGFNHYSAGDLLRGEVKRNTDLGKEIDSYISKGHIVPPSLLMGLIKKSMGEAKSNLFLLDGFPRSLEQASTFEELVCAPKAVLSLECEEDTMVERIMKRAETSGRSDDNETVLRTRFKAFKETSMPVLELYAKRDDVDVLTVNAQGTPDEVYEQAISSIKKVVKVDEN